MIELKLSPDILTRLLVDNDFSRNVSNGETVGFFFDYRYFIDSIKFNKENRTISLFFKNEDIEKSSLSDENNFILEVKLQEEKKYSRDWKFSLEYKKA